MTDTTFHLIPLDCIRASHTNPRKRFDAVALEELAKSITQLGLAQPILVRPIAYDLLDPSIGTRYEIVAGERRFRASTLAGMATIPAIVRDLSDAAALEFQVIENLQRADLHPLEEAEGYEALIRAHGLTPDALAIKVGKSKAYIYGRLKLRALVPAACQAFYDGLLTASTALFIARIPPVANLQARATKDITDGWNGVMPTRRAQQHIEATYMLRLKDASFQLDDATLCPAAGACTVCPRRTGNDPDLFADVASADVCTDPVCYGEKRAAHAVQIKAAAIATGRAVITGEAAKKIMPHPHSHLKHGYVDIDAKIYPKGGGSTTYRKVLGNNVPTVAFLENPHAPGAMLEIAKEADLNVLMKQAGLTLPDSDGVRSTAEKAREKKQEADAKIERECRRRVFLAIRDRDNEQQTPLDERAIAVMLMRECPRTEIDFIANLIGLLPMDYESGKEEGKWVHSNEKLARWIGVISIERVRELIRSLMLVGELTVHTYTGGKDVPKLLIAAAQRLGIPMEPIRAEIKRAAQAKLDAKKKPAGKARRAA